MKTTTAPNSLMIFLLHLQNVRYLSPYLDHGLTGAYRIKRLPLNNVSRQLRLFITSKRVTFNDKLLS